MFGSNNQTLPWAFSWTDPMTPGLTVDCFFSIIAWIDPMTSGLTADCLSWWAFPTIAQLPISSGLMADRFYRLFYLLWLGKKVGIYISPPNPCLKVYPCETWVSIYTKYIYNPLIRQFFFFLNHGAPVLKEVAAVLVSVTASSHSFKCLGYSWIWVVLSRCFLLPPLERCLERIKTILGFPIGGKLELLLLFWEAGQEYPCITLIAIRQARLRNSCEGASVIFF